MWVHWLLVQGVYLKTNPDQWILLDRFSHSLSYVAVACSCMSFNPETRRISVGLENGTVSVC